MTPLDAAVSEPRMAEMLAEIDTIVVQIQSGLWGVRTGLADFPILDRDVRAQIARLHDLDKLLDRFRAELGIAPMPQLIRADTPTPGRMN